MENLTLVIPAKNEKESLPSVLNELKSLKNVRLMPCTTLYGSFDHGIYGALEVKSYNSRNTLKKPRQVLWKIYSKFSVLCTGALERSILFENNDLPGIMLSKSLPESCFEDIENMVKVNLIAPTYLVSQIIPKLTDKHECRQ